jgi:peptidyl-prolyl cis-trans isomerase-like 3
VTLKLNLGDLKIELHCESAPRACENFLALCASDYYKDTIVNRNIKGFIAQFGDPTGGVSAQRWMTPCAGTGLGGQSIWGVPFPDEIQAHLSVRYRQSLCRVTIVQ